MVPLLIRFQHIGPFISVAFGPCWVALAAVFPLGPVLGFFFTLRSRLNFNGSLVLVE